MHGAPLMKPDFSTLSGQVAVVTGAGRGIGEVIAQALAQAGAIVVLTGRSATHLESAVRSIRDKGGHAFSLPLDISLFLLKVNYFTIMSSVNMLYVM